MPSITYSRASRSDRGARENERRESETAGYEASYAEKEARERERAGYGASYENERRESETCVRDNALRGLIRSSSEGGGGGSSAMPSITFRVSGFGLSIHTLGFGVWGLGRFRV